MGRGLAREKMQSWRGNHISLHFPLNTAWNTRNTLYVYALLATQVTPHEQLRPA